MPARLGRYELITQIGQGGMAEVLLAIQRGPAGFEKLVVVKLVHEKLASEKTFVDMLLEEARMAALVKHPNVVDIYDLGQAEGRYFIAMEYLEGEPLLAVLRAGREGRRLDVLSTARLIADTAEGLAAAHDLRTMGGEPLELVHHDVSLGNIVVLYNGQVKLVDFGVAKASQSAGPRIRVQGKFSYMAPEKLRGSRGDRRSDIWSLGCVLWEALTLRRLFKGGNDEDTMRLVLETTLVAPSMVNPEVLAALDPIVMKALARDPAERYATATEMAADLEDVLREQKYGGRNDVIAKYMQSTFASHIDARKKLLQEVSSKGRASADVVEAAFQGEMAQGSPTSVEGREFSVKFRPTTSNPEILLAGARDDASPSKVSLATAGVSQRIARVSGQYLSQPYAPEVAASGGGTVAPPRSRRPIVIVAVVVLVAIAVVFVVLRSGSTYPRAPAKPVTGSAVVLSPVDAQIVDAQIALAAAEPGSDAAVVPPDNAVTPPDVQPAQKPPINRGNAEPLFKAGMQAYVKGDLKAAIVLFRKAVQANSSYGAAWRGLGLANEKLGAWGQAKTAFQKYLQVAPNAQDAPQIRDRIKSL